MARKYSDLSNERLERSVEKHTVDGKIDWEEVATEASEESGRTQKPGAVTMRYSRLMSQNGIKKSSLRGDKTWERFKKFFENILASNHRHALLNSKKRKRRASSRPELLKKKNKEFREEIASLKAELKRHVPMLDFWIQSGKALDSARKRKALMNE